MLCVFAACTLEVKAEVGAVVMLRLDCGCCTAARDARAASRNADDIFMDIVKLMFERPGKWCLPLYDGVLVLSTCPRCDDDGCGLFIHFHGTLPAMR